MIRRLLSGVTPGTFLTMLALNIVLLDALIAPIRH